MNRAANLRRPERRSSRNADLPASIPSSAVIARSEWIALGVLLIAGLLARIAYPERLAIEHFDEGVYASNLFFSDSEGNEYPQRFLYAPPLVPWLQEWSIAILGGGFAGCFTWNVLAGLATIAAVWWTARNWFGTTAGAVAGTIVALGGLETALSRSCLTDTLMGFWWVLGIAMLVRGLETNRYRDSLLSGLCIGLAWCTKYNGWLPLAIALCGIAGRALFERTALAALRRSLLQWSAAALVAAVVWSPVWWGLQSHGGYATVAANHSRYFHGFGEWAPALVRQLENVREFRWPTGGVGMPVALLAGFFLAGIGRVRQLKDGVRPATTVVEGLTTPPRPGGRYRVAIIAALLLALASALPVAGLVVGPAVATIAPILCARTRRAERQSTTYADWFALSWIASLFVLTPLYQPYPRLMLPWVLGAAFATSRLPALLRIAVSSEDPDRPAGSGDTGHGLSGATWIVPTLAAAVAVLAFVAGVTPLPEDRSGLARSVGEIVDTLDREAASPTDGYVVYVFAEPAAFFHIARANRLAGPVSDLKFAESGSRRLPMPTFLVVGPHARQSEIFASDWERYGGYFQRIGSWDYRPSRFVLLDRYSSESLRAKPEWSESLELFRLD